MLNTIWGVVRDGKVEPIDESVLPEGAHVLMTVMNDQDAAFWTRLSQESLKSIWDNEEDDVYAQLLQR